MSDAGRVRALMTSGTLVHPAGAPNLVDLSLAMASLCGVEDIGRTDAIDALRNAIGDADHYVFVLVDGMGASAVEKLALESFLRRHVRVELRTVYPSSTAPALTSLATGRWPGEHAVTGWWTYLPWAGRTATILPYVERFTEAGLDAGAVGRAATFPATSLMGMYQRDVAVVQPANITGSVYSGYFAGDRAQHAYDRLSDASQLIAARVEQATAPTFTYFYVPFFDAASHTRGPASSEAALALARIERRIEELAARLSGRARVVVSADHGSIEVDRRSRRVWTRADALMALLALPPSGEPRAPYFHVRAGEEERFASMFRERYGAAWALLGADEAAEVGLLGRAVSGETESRIGTYVGVALAREVVMYEPADTLRAMRGFHGGLTAEEMRVPVIVV